MDWPVPGEWHDKITLKYIWNTTRLPVTQSINSGQQKRQLGDFFACPTQQVQSNILPNSFGAPAWQTDPSKVCRRPQSRLCLPSSIAGLKYLQEFCKPAFIMMWDISAPAGGQQETRPAREICNTFSYTLTRTVASAILPTVNFPFST